MESKKSNQRNRNVSTFKKPNETFRAKKKKEDEKKFNFFLTFFLSIWLARTEEKTNTRASSQGDAALTRIGRRRCAFVFCSLPQVHTCPAAETRYAQINSVVPHTPADRTRSFSFQMDVSVDRFHIEFHVEIQVDAIKWSLADGTESDGYSEEWAALKKRISTNEERPLNQSSTTAMTSLSRNQSPRNRILRLVFFWFFFPLVVFWFSSGKNET